MSTDYDCFTEDTLTYSHDDISQLSYLTTGRLVENIKLANLSNASEWNHKTRDYVRSPSESLIVTIFQMLDGINERLSHMETILNEIVVHMNRNVIEDGQHNCSRCQDKISSDSLQNNVYTTPKERLNHTLARNYAINEISDRINVNNDVRPTCQDGFYDLVNYAKGLYTKDRNDRDRFHWRDENNPDISLNPVGGSPHKLEMGIMSTNRFFSETAYYFGRIMHTIISIIPNITSIQHSKLFETTRINDAITHHSELLSESRNFLVPEDLSKAIHKKVELEERNGKCWLQSYRPMAVPDDVKIAIALNGYKK